MKGKSGLSTELQRYLPDSEIEVVAWDHSTLTLRITKEIGPEVGLLRLSNVSHVNLPPWLTIARIECADSDALPPSFFDTNRPADRKLDANEKVYLFHGSWGEEYFVIAQDIGYEPVS